MVQEIPIVKTNISIKCLRWLFACSLCIAALAFSTRSVSAAEEEAAQTEKCEKLRQFTFSWQFVDQCNMQARGGTSRGADLKLDPDPHTGWLSLQERELKKFERDRRAILAMAGPYRTSFDFLETVGYTKGFEPDPPYQSWGTEYIYVAEDRGEFISLQHIMVMVYEDEDGNLSEPFVQKHWRQDWHYEDKEILVYAGNDTFKQKTFSRGEVKGKWSQAVYQVDDSPRYQAVGAWRHEGGVSTWLSDETWRPLPRRESSFRSDYQVLIGTNRHTITPTGWVQEEENLKAIVGLDGALVPGQAYLSKELGVARYERIVNFDFSAGDQYWQQTQNFWKDVKTTWDNIMARNESFGLKKSVNGTPLFMPFFNYAEQVREAGSYNSKDGRLFAETTLLKYLIIE